MSERNSGRASTEEAGPESSEDAFTITVEVDPMDFDEPRHLMWDRLVEEFGEARIEEVVRANIEEDVSGQAMRIVNAVWDNRDQLDAAVSQEDLDAEEQLSPEGGR